MGFIGELIGTGVRISNAKKQRENMKPEIQAKIDKVSSLAKTGDVRAMYALASFYADGKEIYPDYDKSEYWWKMAAEKGHIDSQYNLGMLYLGKFAMEFTNDGKAAYWLTRAAEKGDIGAKEALNKYFRKSLFTGEWKRRLDS